MKILAMAHLTGQGLEPSIVQAMSEVVTQGWPRGREHSHRGPRDEVHHKSPNGLADTAPEA